MHDHIMSRRAKVLAHIEFVSFYEFTIGEVMYCICVLGDINFIYYWRSHVLYMCVRGY